MILINIFFISLLILFGMGTLLFVLDGAALMMISQLKRYGLIEQDKEAYSTFWPRKWHQRLGTQLLSIFRSEKKEANIHHRELMKVLLGLDDEKLEKLLEFYRAEFGDGAARYARKTYRKWEKGEVRPIKQTFERFLIHLPKVMDYDLKCEVLRHLMEAYCAKDKYELKVYTDDWEETLEPLVMNSDTISELNSNAPGGAGKLLGIKAADTLELERLIERGFAFEKLERIRRETGYPLEVLAASVRLSSRTLSRRKKEKKLTPAESDRLVTVSRLLNLAVELFEGEKEKAFRWFRSPNRALGNLTPLETASTETGSREVENLIGRLEHGVFS